MQLIRLELPADANFGDVVSLDTKHILAWVKENNPKAYVDERFDKTQQPRGDPDCKLGCKRRHNQGEGNGSEADCCRVRCLSLCTHRPGHADHQPPPRQSYQRR